MAWIFDTYSMNKGHSVLGVVTGKPLTIGGSLGREEATARGALYCIRDALAKQRRCARRACASPSRASATSARYLAKFLAEDGATVVAISDSTTALYNPNGIDVAAAFAHKRETRLARRARRAPSRSRTRSCCSLDCDVLAPCALEQVITERERRRRSRRR